MQASQMLKKPPTHDANREIKGEKFTLNGVNPKDLKLVLDGETAKKENGVAPAKVQLVDCQSAQQSVGKEPRSSAYGPCWSRVGSIELRNHCGKGSHYIRQAGRRRHGRLLLFVRSRAVTGDHARLSEGDDCEAEGGQQSTSTYCIDQGGKGYMKLKDAPGIKDYTLPSMGKVLTWAKLDKFGAKIEVTKPSFHQPPKPGTVQKSLSVV